MKLQITTLSNSNDVEKKMEDSLMQLDNISYEEVKQSGFDGLQVLYFLLCSTGGVCLITSIKEIILRLISRNDVKSVKIGEVELTGYNQKDVVKILDEMQAQELEGEKK